jgi:hypothetical protein
MRLRYSNKCAIDNAGACAEHLASMKLESLSLLTIGRIKRQVLPGLLRRPHSVHDARSGFASSLGENCDSVPMRFGESRK